MRSSIEFAARNGTLQNSVSNPHITTLGSRYIIRSPSKTQRPKGGQLGEDLRISNTSPMNHSAE
jgi:hypothetical protein